MKYSDDMLKLEQYMSDLCLGSDIRIMAYERIQQGFNPVEVQSELDDYLMEVYA